VFNISKYLLKRPILESEIESPRKKDKKKINFPIDEEKILDYYFSHIKI
jgi:hypothetical protein